MNGTKQKTILTGRNRTIDLGITAEAIYSPPLYQLSYGEFTYIHLTDDTHNLLPNRLLLFFFTLKTLYHTPSLTESLLSSDGRALDF